MLEQPIILKCGVAFRNRIAKSAMTEGLADALNRVTPAHERLYRRWAGGGLGMQITGNVQVDRAHLERPGNVAIEGPPDAQRMAGLRAMAAAARAGGCSAWVQLSHAGRQTPIAVNPRPKAASAVRVALPGKQFGEPEALTEIEIEALVDRFAEAAIACRDAGFDGVQVHAAHGYLLSGFLSPLANRRDDRWGGTLANRARLLLRVVRTIRAACGLGFGVAVKLNSADFQRGGFGLDECAEVARMLEDDGIDLLELSGGNYEQPRMMDSDGLNAGEARSARREAYFLAEAERVRAAVRLPLMVTGGFRTAAGMRAALEGGAVDVVGVARPLCVDVEGPARLLADPEAALPSFEARLRLGPGPLGPRSSSDIVRMLNGFGVQAWFCMQILALAADEPTDPRLPVWRALARYAAREAAMAKALERAA